MKFLIQKLRENPKYTLKLLFKFIIKGYWYKSEEQMIGEILGPFGVIKVLKYELSKYGEVK